jgi:hypothetical protein
MWFEPYKQRLPAVLKGSEMRGDERALLIRDISRCKKTTQ